MRVLLVTAHEFLPFAVTQVLNARNEYCAVVVDEVEPARKFLSQFNYSAENVFPLYELPECVENFLLDRALRYYQKNFSDFEMFASGMSYTDIGLLPKCFTKKL